MTGEGFRTADRRPALSGTADAAGRRDPAAD